MIGTSWTQLNQVRYTREWIKQQICLIFETKDKFDSLAEYEQNFVRHMYTCFRSDISITDKQWAFMGALARRVDRN